MSLVFKRVWSAVTWAAVALVVVLAILLVGVRLVGLMPYTVLSGSMEPTYHVGSMIYVKSVDPSELKVGDPVTFYLNESTVATHRIIEILEDEKNPSVRYFKTQGDANESADSDPVRGENVIGKPIFTVPYLGYLANVFQQQSGRVLVLVICLALMLLFILPDIISKFIETMREGDPTPDSDPAPNSSLARELVELLDKTPNAASDAELMARISAAVNEYPELLRDSELSARLSSILVPDEGKN